MADHHHVIIHEDTDQEPADGSLSIWERRMVKAQLVFGSIFMASLMTLLIVITCGSGATEVATFSVELAGFQGLNATTLIGNNVVSPTFSLKVRVENPRDLQPWCSNGGKVVVSYSGVALAWGDVPGFCVPRKTTRGFVLLPWGKGVGLSEGLRRRLASELFAGTARVVLEMKLFNDANDWRPSSETYSGASLQSFELMLRAAS